MSSATATSETETDADESSGNGIQSHRKSKCVLSDQQAGKTGASAEEADR